MLHLLGQERLPLDHFGLHRMRLMHQQVRRRLQLYVLSYITSALVEDIFKAIEYPTLH
ncbi:hypothetical protein D3C85_1878080 [compost metagenome]